MQQQVPYVLGPSLIIPHICLSLVSHSLREFPLRATEILMYVFHAHSLFSL